MLLDGKHDVQSNDIHLLEGTFGCLEHVLEDGVDFGGRGHSFGGDEEGFAFDCGPDSGGVSEIPRRASSDDMRVE